jgi:hypothetical protein
VRKKLNAAAGLVTIAAAGALIASTPAYAEESIAPAATSTVTVPAAAVAGHQLNLVAGTTVTGDHHRRRHRHRRHHRRHHHRHHRY